MNYRHAYHAGNFADVLKHLVLALVLEHMKLKEAPFRVIDTHAGTGLYDLGSVEAAKTGEWQTGIARLVGAQAPADVAEVLAPYLAAVAADNPGGSVSVYPGSPRQARHLMRPGDLLVANELHPEDRERLAETFRGDRQVKVMGLDGWTALKSLLPPKERRGVVLVDPPFEEPGELDRLADGLEGALQRFATGIYLLWYPIKDPRPIRAFHDRIERLALDKALIVELWVRGGGDPTALNGTGMVVVNQPHTLQAALERVLPWLAERLASGPGQGKFALRRIGKDRT